jgi:hypothetical protein
MSRIALETTSDKEFSLISEYYVSGKSEDLPEYLQKILDRWRAADRILMKFPRKSVAARKLQVEFPNISIRQAQHDLNNACKFWNINTQTDKNFLYRFLVTHLTESIVSASTPDFIKSKDKATLAKLYASIEADPIDPKFMEKSTVNIQFNLNQNNIYFTEQELKSLPIPIRQKIMALTQTAITEDETVEIMNN